MYVWMSSDVWSLGVSYLDCSLLISLVLGLLVSGYMYGYLFSLNCSLMSIRGYRY